MTGVPVGISRWLDPGWRRCATGWIQQRLAVCGIREVRSIEQLHVEPWATVMRIRTEREVIWFKANGPANRCEGRIVQVLSSFAPANVARLLAVDEDRGWFLAVDAGTPMTELLEPDGLTHWTRVMAQYGQMQFDLAAACRQLLEVGAPDHRPEIMPRVLAWFLDGDGVELLRGGLSTETLIRLRRVQGRFADWCAFLADTGVAPTIQHDDLWEGNVFLDGRDYRFIDWTDVAVAYPFGSLIYPERSVIESLSFAPDGAEIERLRAAYLEPWTATCDAATLRRAVGVAKRVAAVGRAVAWNRALAGVDRSALGPYEAAAEARWLAALLAP